MQGKGSNYWTCLGGRFYRACDQHSVGDGLAGSVRAGRYSREDQPTLYLSSSAEGVNAAMIAHREPGSWLIKEYVVKAERIYDLRSIDALQGSGFALSDALGNWSLHLARGDDPPSWRVRDWIEMHGADGLIDPSRKVPGLWHLVLFRWNCSRGPQVTPAQLSA